MADDRHATRRREHRWPAKSYDDILYEVDGHKATITR